MAGFDRHADGSLTAIPGSPFSVGGAGLGSPDASQGSLQLSANGRFLLAVDAGSNQVSVLRIEHNGSLQAVNGSPVSSGGVDPVSIGVDRNLVYVANAGPGANVGDTNYTGFRLQPGNGLLQPIPNSTYVLPNDSKPGQILFNGNGRKAAGTRIATSEIDSFTVSHQGLLIPAAGSPYLAQAFSPAQGWGQLGSEFSPTQPNELFVSDAHTAAGGAAFPGLVSSFIDGIGRLPDPGRRPGRQRRRRGLLGRDQPRRQVPVRRQHRLGLDLELLDRQGRRADVPAEHPPRPDRRRARRTHASRRTAAPSGSSSPGRTRSPASRVQGGTLTPLSQIPGPGGAHPSGIVVN